MACPECLRRGLLLRELAARIGRVVDRGRGSRARDLLALGDADLCRAAGTRPETALPGREGLDDALSRLRLELEEADCWVACGHEADWPAALERLGESAPRALYGRGARELLAALSAHPAVTVIGARRAGSYGLDVAASLCKDLAAAGLPVISGMALGIDGAAHRGALDGGGMTVAVLASGADRPYPRARAALYREITTEGLVLSELPPLSGTFRWMFPARNRLMAALAEMTIVVEAAERSGSLITAEMAVDCGRPVGAVPGPVNGWRSRGANMLLAEGAAVIRGAQDVLDQLLGAGVRATFRGGPSLSGTELAALDAIEAGAATADQIVAGCGLGPEAVAEALGSLELGGYVEVDLGGACRRTALPAASTPSPQHP